MHTLFSIQIPALFPILSSRNIPAKAIFSYDSIFKPALKKWQTSSDKVLYVRTDFATLKHSYFDPPLHAFAVVPECGLKS